MVEQSYEARMQLLNLGRGTIASKELPKMILLVAIFEILGTQAKAAFFPRRRLKLEVGCCLLEFSLTLLQSSFLLNKGCLSPL